MYVPITRSSKFYVAVKTCLVESFCHMQTQAPVIYALANLES